MKITRLRTHLLTTQWTDDPTFPQMLHSTAIIRIETDGGGDGLGESTLGYFAPEAVPAMVDFFAPLLIGADPLDVTRLTRVMTDSSVAVWDRPVSGHHPCASFSTVLTG